MFNALPAFPDISLEVWSVSDDGQTVSLRYVGCESDVVSAGVVDAELIAKKHAKAKRPGGGRRDADGDRIKVQRWNLVREGVVVPRIKLMFREKLLANAMKLPGFAVVWKQWQQKRAEDYADGRKDIAQRTSPTDVGAGSQISGADVAAGESLDAAMRCVRRHVTIMMSAVGHRLRITEAAQESVDSAVDFLERRLGEAIRTGAKPRATPTLRLVVDNTR